MPKSSMRWWRWSLPAAVASVAALAYGWWFTDREPFSPAAFRSLLVVVGVVIAAAEVHRARRQPGPMAARAAPSFRVAVVVWSVLVVAVVAWELIALRSSPRSAHPTLSSLVEGLEHHHLARLALYAAWVWFGWTMAS